MQANLAMQANLILRFLLELAGIVAIGYCGLQAPGELRLLLGIGLPIGLIVLWARFIAPRADSPFPPAVRIVLGSLLLLATAIALYYAGQPVLAIVFAALIVINTVLLFVLSET